MGMMERQVASWVPVVLTLVGILVGIGTAWGLSVGRLDAIESRLEDIQTGLRERTDANTNAISAHETRIRMLEIEQARMMRGQP